MSLVRAALFCILAACIWLTAGCESDDNTDGLTPANTTTITQDTSGGDLTVGYFIIPAGTDVTSQEIDAQGHIAFSVGQVPPAILSSFTGNILGSVALVPLDAVFSRFVTIGVPAGASSGVVHMYHYETSATSQTATWERVGTGNVRNGTAAYETMAFGYFIAGSDASPYPEPEIPAAPANLAASDGTFVDRVQLSWEPSYGAADYWVYRDSQSARIATVTGVTTWDDMYVVHDQGGGGTLSVSDVSDREEHTYWVRAVNSAGASDFSDPDTGYVGEHDGGGGGDI